MSRRHYSQAHYQRLSNGGPDTPAQIAERVAHRAACERAHREMLARYAPLTPSNAAEAVRWQEARIRELTAPALTQ